MQNVVAQAFEEPAIFFSDHDGELQWSFREPTAWARRSSSESWARQGRGRPHAAPPRLPHPVSRPAPGPSRGDVHHRRQEVVAVGQLERPCSGAQAVEAAQCSAFTLAASCPPPAVVRQLNHPRNSRSHNGCAAAASPAFMPGIHPSRDRAVTVAWHESVPPASTHQSLGPLDGFRRRQAMRTRARGRPDRLLAKSRASGERLELLASVLLLAVDLDTADSGAYLPYQCPPAAGSQ